MDWKNPAAYAGWMQLAAGVFSFILQAINAFRGGPVDPLHSSVTTGLLAGGTAHVLSNGRK